MLTLGQKLENGIEALISLSTEIAELQARYNDAVGDLSMYNSLIQIQKYLGSGSELSVLLPSIEDVIVGVFGTNWCKIVLNDKDISQMPINSELSIKQLDTLEICNFRIGEENEKELFGLNEGKLLVVRMGLMDDRFGYIILYWSYSLKINDNSMRFLELLKSQLEISIQNAQLISKFKDMSVTDPLTGVYNRAFFNNSLAISKPNEGDCIVMFDIDHFKLVNDSKGHAYGDRVLKEFACILADKCSSETKVIRYGGEEFVVACSGKTDAELLAENVRTQFEEETGYTVSAGIAICHGLGRDTSYEELCRQADHAMYLSKENGRNRTTIYGEPHHMNI